VGSPHNPHRTLPVRNHTHAGRMSGERVLTHVADLSDECRGHFVNQ
jgi:hypothetical protein